MTYPDDPSEGSRPDPLSALDSRFSTGVVEVGGGLRLAYREWRGDGRPIGLLHGLASNAGIWEPVAARLSPRFRVVALDQRGHGRSDKPTDGYDFDRVVADASEAFGRLGVVRPLLVGHSWGGNVALHYA